MDGCSRCATISKPSPVSSSSGDGRYPGGVYTVLYDGDGEIAFAGENEVVGKKAGHIDLRVTPTPAGITLILQKSNPADPIRNIRVILPGHESTYKTHPWYPPFLNALRPFNTIRFMGWQAVNFNMEKDWSDRRLPSYATQANLPFYAPSPEMKGVSYEDIIALSNELNENPWINVPGAASDDYIRQMAKLFHQTLKPNLHPMIEYGNEMWNAGASFQFCNARDQAVALKLTSNPGSPCSRDDKGKLVPPPDAWAAIGQWYYYALRLSQIFDIWDAEYGAEKSKIVHIVAEWTGIPYEVEVVLKYGQAANHLADKADVIATGGYVSPFSSYSPAVKSGRMTWEQLAKMSPGDIIKAMHDSIDKEVVPQFKASQQEAQRWGLGLVVYEGGDGNASNLIGPYTDPIARLYAATARDPGMADVYKHLLDAWKASGGSLFNQFYDVGGYGAFGQWGMLEYQDQDPASSPKFRALTDWIEKSRK